VINSDYAQAIEAAEQKSKIDYDKYLKEQAEREQEQEIWKRKENEQVILQLNREIEQQQYNLYDYDKFSAIGKRNIKRVDHERKQTEIQQKILELKEQIKSLQ